MTYKPCSWQVKFRGGIRIRNKRKAEHLELAINAAEGPRSSGLEDVHLVPDSVPDLAMQDIDLGTDFLGKYLHYPILINALTGGTEPAKKINRTLASLAHKYGLAMAVGSMTIAIEDSSVQDSFQVVREANPDGVILANCGANITPEQACQAVNLIRADGLQLHFNVPQELAMAEGDRDFRGIVENVGRIIEACPVPVIAKEVGFGLARETAVKLYGAGIRIFDNGGCGGTNFVVIEDQRQGMFAHQLDDWGMSTAASLAEIVSLQLPAQVIASGGIRTAADIAKVIAMGADVAGITGLFIRILQKMGPEELERHLAGLIYQLRAVFLMCGARDCRQIRTKPVLILGNTAEWLLARNIYPADWANR